MKNIFLTVAIATSCITASAQQKLSVEEVMQEVERNNTTLMAKADERTSGELKAMSGIFLENPEVEFGYLWGNPATGNRIDVSVSQTFDFPSVYAYRRQVARGEQSLSQSTFRAARREILLETARRCVELVYLNAMSRELQDRHTAAQKLAASYKKQLATGSATILESNKAQMALLSLENSLADIESQRVAALTDLQRLNGGQAISFTQDSYDDSRSKMPLIDNFEAWFDSMARLNPALEYLATQIEIGKKQVKLSTAMGLPKFSLGYKSEAVMPGEQFQGISASVSIPLWENKNNVKAARASLRAAESMAVDGKLQFYEQLRALYERAKALEKIDRAFHNSYKELSSTELLGKALAAGEISIVEYFVEMSLTYSLVDQGLTTQRDLSLTRAELFSFAM